jgi:hypothetical protein
MSLDTRFTEEEQFLLTNTPFTIGSAMVFAEGSGLGTVKELFSNTKSFMEGAKSFPQNEIIVGILPNMADRKEAMAEAKAFQERSKAWFKEKGIDSSEKMHQLVIDNSREVARLLKEKATPEEAAEYKEWAMSIAESVAKAAKEGGFLGFGGERVSAGEKQLYADIADALGSSSQLS